CAVESNGLQQLTAEREHQVSRGSHLQSRCHHQDGVRLYFESIFPRGGAACRHQIELLPQLFRRVRDVSEPFQQFWRCIKATQVQVTRAIPEPPPHLHQRVVHAGGSQKVTYAETLQGQAPRELIPADREDLQPG